MKRIMILVICFILFGFSCDNKDRNCGDDYDRCCDECYEYYKQTGLSTECYGKCYDKFAECEDKKEDPMGCFVESIAEGKI